MIFQPIIVQCGHCGEQYVGHHDCNSGRGDKYVRKLEAEIRLLQDVIKMLLKDGQ